MDGFTKNIQEQTQPTFIVETVNAIDRRTLVVATQEEEVLRVLNLVRQQETNRLQRL